MTTAYLSHPLFLAHDPGPFHPESKARLYAIEDRLNSAHLYHLLHHLTPVSATREQLLRVHDGAYIDSLIAAAPEEGTLHMDPDTVMSPATLNAAFHAAGAVVMATDAVLNGDVVNAFCAVRPPGHHAERGLAMGFCFFNNLAVGVAHALEVHGLKRVAIVDFDVHHGNGTEDIFRDDKRVMFCSSFQYPFYPYSPLVEGHERIIHTPLESGTDGALFRRLISEQWFPALHRFEPEMIFISAGFDAHIEDEISAIRLQDQDYEWITGELISIADQYAGSRIVSVLEGGYETDALARSVALHIRALLGNI
ncbi:MAG: histone deacetylase family protein [Candidatus Sedimenticola sp. (ex Thyasira tokunagai)]